MMGGHAFERFFGNKCDGDFIRRTATENVSKILNIDAIPDMCRVSVLRDCIPQQVVGHNARITWLMNHIELEKLPLFLVGNAYKGTGINDVILSAKETAEAIEKCGKSVSSESSTPRYIVDYM
jgi:oxygen-dependent protoporphyrinogen oxidase